jgi:hypothetical protein
MEELTPPTLSDAIEFALEESAKYGLHVEVIQTALQFAQNNPEVDLRIILSEAMSEWDV